MNTRKRPETVQIVKQRRDAALQRLIQSSPYARYLEIELDRRGDELTAILPYRDDLIGNPMLPALHGGVVGGFLETSAIMELTWSAMWQEMEGQAAEGETNAEIALIRPRTIDFTVDYLRMGLPRDSYARARVNRSGRRYASVHVEAWQDNRDRLFAQATGHFMMPFKSEA